MDSRRLTLRRKDQSAYDQAMRCLAVMAMLVLVIVQPAAAQSFKPDVLFGLTEYDWKDYKMSLKQQSQFAVHGTARAQFCFRKTKKDCNRSGPNPLWGYCATYSGCRHWYHS